MLCWRHGWEKCVIDDLECLLLRTRREIFGFDVEVCSLESLRD